MNSSKSDKRHLSTIITQSTGLTIKDFITKVIGDRYHNFQHRLRTGRILVSDYLIIHKVTGVSLDEIIANDPRYQDDLEHALNVAANYKELAAQDAAPELETPPEIKEEPEEVEFKFEDI